MYDTLNLRVMFKTKISKHRYIVTHFAAMLCLS